MVGFSGTTNTGGGGGGGAGTTNGLPRSGGGAGGSGIVIIRYADSYPAASATTGSPTITVAGGYRVYTWTASGSVTMPTQAAGTAGLGWVLMGNIKGAAGAYAALGYTGSAGAGYTGSSGYTGSASTATGYTGSIGSNPIVQSNTAPTDTTVLWLDKNASGSVSTDTLSPFLLMGG